MHTVKQPRFWWDDPDLSGFVSLHDTDGKSPIFEIYQLALIDERKGGAGILYYCQEKDFIH